MKMQISQCLVKIKIQFFYLMVRYTITGAQEELEDKGIKFSTSHSDSETVLNGLDYFGVDFIKNLEDSLRLFI